VDARRLLGHGGFEAAISAYEALFEDFGHSPLVYTHRGELLLWAGRYDEAAADFEEALRLESTTRWAWAGLGACFIFRGEPMRALATFLLGRTRALPALTTDAYRGEAWRALGNQRRAVAAFERARALHPARASVHLNLALHHALARQPHAVIDHIVTFRDLAPGLFRAMLRESAIDVRALTSDLENAALVFAHGLRMMRGNRSSGYVSWFCAEGRAHAEGAPSRRATPL
jgi:tetratricopeptide (TPR) repeat protein